MQAWHDLFMTAAGAAATLAGLIFVGLSINLKKILATAQLPSRSFSALILLLTILIVSIFMLVPNTSAAGNGVNLIVVGLVVWVIVVRSDRGIYLTTPKEYRRQYCISIIIHQLALLPYIVAGIDFLMEGTNGMSWIFYSIIFSFINAVLDAWVLMVEINR